jgi:hypothetical protein
MARLCTARSFDGGQTQKSSEGSSKPFTPVLRKDAVKHRVPDC